jgi:hypothetical protein
LTGTWKREREEGVRLRIFFKGIPPNELKIPHTHTQTKLYHLKVLPSPNSAIWGPSLCHMDF